MAVKEPRRIVLGVVVVMRHLEDEVKKCRGAQQFREPCQAAAPSASPA